MAQREGRTNLGTTSIYLPGIDPEEIITAVRAPRADDVGQRQAAALIDRDAKRGVSTPLAETIQPRP